MTEIELHRPQNELRDQMEFARTVVARPEGGARSLLPDSYRDNPANVLIAVGLGSAMGLSPAESLYRIDVIQGKPTAGAELIAANVRKAGHKLRVQGDETTCTATIIRADDPDFPFTVTRDLEWAKAMGLTSKDNYKKQPGTMLQWRAITAVARLACPEALYGVAYTADELTDAGPAAPSSGGLGAALAQTVTVEQVHPQTGDAEGSQAETSVAEGEAGSIPAGNPSASPLLDVTGNLAKAMFATINEAGIPDTEQRAYIAKIIGREITSRKELTDDDARLVIDATKAALDEPFPSEGDQ